MMVMKSMLVVVSFILSNFQLSAQSHKKDVIMWPYNSADKIEFTKSIQVPGANADSLYANAKRFVQKTFNSERDTIVINDVKRSIIGKAAFILPIPELGEKGKGYISFHLSILCRNNTVRYTFTDFNHYPINADGVYGGALENIKAASGGMNLHIGYWNDEKARAYYRIQTTIERLQESLIKNNQSAN